MGCSAGRVGGTLGINTAESSTHCASPSAAGSIGVGEWENGENVEPVPLTALDTGAATARGTPTVSHRRDHAPSGAALKKRGAGNACADATCEGSCGGGGDIRRWWKAASAAARPCCCCSDAPTPVALVGVRIPKGFLLYDKRRPSPLISPSRVLPYNSLSVLVAKFTSSNYPIRR